MHLDRLIAVLETVASAGRAVSPVDVQRATDIPRPTCYRLLQTLAEHRLLDEPEGGSRYLIGDRLKQLEAKRAQAEDKVAAAERLARREEELIAQEGANVHLASRTESDLEKASAEIRARFNGRFRMLIFNGLELWAINSPLVSRPTAIRPT